MVHMVWSMAMKFCIFLEQIVEGSILYELNDVLIHFFVHAPTRLSLIHVFSVKLKNISVKLFCFKKDKLQLTMSVFLVEMLY